MSSFCQLSCGYQAWTLSSTPIFSSIQWNYKARLTRQTFFLRGSIGVSLEVTADMLPYSWGSIPKLCTKKGHLRSSTVLLKIFCGKCRFEAGGHGASAATVLTLIPEIVDVVTAECHRLEIAPTIPVVAAGGFADGRQVSIWPRGNYSNAVICLFGNFATCGLSIRTMLRDLPMNGRPDLESVIQFLTSSWIECNLAF